MTNYRRIARQDARRYGLDPNVFGRQIKQESGYNPNIVSPAGARGIAQFMPGTARGLGVNPDDPIAALNAAAKLMAGYVQKYGSYKNALVAYNAGPGRVGGPLPAETQNYIKSILGGQNPKSSQGGHYHPPSVAPATTGATGADPRTQIALSLLGLGNLSGGYGGGDSLTNSLLAAAQAQQLPKPSAPSQPSYGGNVRGAVVGSPLPGVRAHRPTHETAGLPGYPAYDYMGKAGSPVVAPVSGRIVKLSGHDPSAGPTQGPHGPFGWSVYVQGDNGKTYFLTHLGSRNVRVGQRVKAGAQIGTIGNYAKYGTPSHVHEGVHG